MNRRSWLKVIRMAGVSLLVVVMSTTAIHAATGYGSGTGSSSSSPAKSFHVLKNAKKWMQVSTSHKTVTFKVVAGYNGSNAGLNFDGYSSGNANFVTPLGWNVVVKFSNNSADMTHSFGIATNHGDNLKIAKINGKQIQTPDPTMGTSQGTTVTLKFKATPAGKYFANCEMPGHSSSGMYLRFTIDKTVKAPEIMVR